MTTDGYLRFCVIGAGAAGLAAASKLLRMGHTHVTVLERSEVVGGKCRTEMEEDAPLDVGAIYVLPNYPTVGRFVESTGMRLVQARPLQHLGIDGDTRPFGKRGAQHSLRGKIEEYLRLGAQMLRYRQVFQRPLGELERWIFRELALPYARWKEENRLEFFHEVAYPMMRSFGYGYEEQKIPALYILKSLFLFARNGNPLSLWNVPGIALFQVDPGYGEMWQRVARPLDVRLGARVERLQRAANGGSVEIGTERIEFDRLILACPLDEVPRFADASNEERMLFGKIRSFDLWQARARVSGLSDAMLLDGPQSYSSVGRAMVYLRSRRESDWYYFAGYVGNKLSFEEIQSWLPKDIADLGGRLESQPVFARWNDYFPHYGSEEVREGYHARLEALQGQQSTYYVGELLSPLGVEASAAYAERLMEKHFGI